MPACRSRQGACRVVLAGHRAPCLPCYGMAACCGNGPIATDGRGFSVERMDGLPQDRSAPRAGSTAWALVGGQTLTAAIAGLVVWIGWGPTASLAAMFGGSVVILPTLYFAIQGLAILLERRIPRRQRIARRAFALAVVGLPAFIVFPPPFVLDVFVPFMRAIGAA